MSKVEDTETTAMDAWLKMLEEKQPRQYAPKGVPVRDPSSQLPEPRYSASNRLGSGS